MPEWFYELAHEWSFISASPISFAIALVVFIIVIWAILHFFYRRMLSSKDIQIEVLQNRLADYRNVLEGASPREAAYKITQLKGQLECVEGALPGIACGSIFAPQRPTAWLGSEDSNSEMSSQIIPLKARADSPDPSRIPAMETTRV